RGAGRLPHRDLRRRLAPAPPGTQLVTVRDSTRWTGSSSPRSRPGRPQPPTPLRTRRRAGLRLPGRTRLLRLTDPAHLAGPDDGSGARAGTRVGSFPQRVDRRRRRLADRRGRRTGSFPTVPPVDGRRLTGCPHRRRLGDQTCDRLVGRHLLPVAFARLTARGPI